MNAAIYTRASSRDRATADAASHAGTKQDAGKKGAGQAEVPTVVERRKSWKMMGDLPTIGVSKGDVLSSGDLPVEAGRVLIVKHWGQELVAQVYRSRARKALRVRLLGTPPTHLDMAEVEVLGVAVCLWMHERPSDWPGEIRAKLRAWQCDGVSWDL